MRNSLLKIFPKTSAANCGSEVIGETRRYHSSTRRKMFFLTVDECNPDFATINNPSEVKSSGTGSPGMAPALRAEGGNYARFREND